MKLLLDTCVWGKSRPELIAEGHDVTWAGEWEEDPGDREILARAHREARVLVTLDKDFGTLTIIENRPHSGIIRLVGIAARRQASTILRVLELHSQELQLGAIVTVSPGQVRIRPSS